MYRDLIRLFRNLYISTKKIISKPSTLSVVFCTSLVYFATNICPYLLPAPQSESIIISNRKEDTWKLSYILVANATSIVPLLIDRIMNIFLYIPDATSTLEYMPTSSMVGVIFLGDLAIVAVFVPLQMEKVISLTVNLISSAVIVGILGQIHHFTPKEYSFPFCCLLGMSLLSSILLNSFAQIYESIAREINFSNMVVVGLSLAAFLYRSVCWMKSVRDKRAETLPAHTFVTLLYVVFFVVLLLILFFMLHLVPAVTNTTTIGAGGRLYLSALFGWLSVGMLLMTVLTSRLSRWKALSMAQSVVAGKEFVRYVSHEIRTPLNIVMAGLRVVEGDILRGASGGELTETVKDIRSSCIIAVDSLAEILAGDGAGGAADAMATSLDMTEFRVQPFFTECLRPFYIRATAAGVSLQESFDHMARNPALRIRADESKLNEVLVSLVGNAIKHTPRGGSVKVLVAIHRGDKFLKIEVVDTGAGLSKEGQARLFGLNKASTQPGSRGRPGRRSATTGFQFGLRRSLLATKAIVELHQGDISVYSAGEGFGCVFTVSIPLHIAAHSESEFDPTELFDTLSPLPCSIARFDRKFGDVVRSFRLASTVSRIRRSPQGVSYSMHGADVTQLGKGRDMSSSSQSRLQAVRSQRLHLKRLSEKLSFRQQLRASKSSYLVPGGGGGGGSGGLGRSQSSRVVVDIHDLRATVEFEDTVVAGKLVIPESVPFTQDQLQLGFQENEVSEAPFASVTVDIPFHTSSSTSRRSTGSGPTSTPPGQTPSSPCTSRSASQRQKLDNAKPGSESSQHTLFSSNVARGPPICGNESPHPEPQLLVPDDEAQLPERNETGFELLVVGFGDADVELLRSVLQPHYRRIEAQSSGHMSFLQVKGAIADSIGSCPDVILMSMQVQDMDPRTFVMAVRYAGYRGRIIVLGGGEEGEEEGLFTSGADLVYLEALDASLCGKIAELIQTDYFWTSLDSKL